MVSNSYGFTMVLLGTIISYFTFTCFDTRVFFGLVFFRLIIFLIITLASSILLRYMAIM